MTTDNFCFCLQNRLIQTNQTGGQWYSDTSPFSIPWLKVRLHMRRRWRFVKIGHFSWKSHRQRYEELVCATLKRGPLTQYLEESYPQLTNGSNKLECSSLASLSSLVLCNTLTFWIHSKVTKKMKCCELNT
jgi:hypothetical protein